MPKKLTPISKGSNTKFRYLERGQSVPHQPGSQRAIVWSSCGGGGGGGSSGAGGVKWQTAKGFTEKGTALIERSQGLIAGGGLLLLSGFGAGAGVGFIVWGFAQNIYASATQYVTFTRPCNEKTEQGV